MYTIFRLNFALQTRKFQESDLGVKYLRNVANRPDEWPAHQDSCFEPKCWMNEVESFQVLSQPAVNHLVTILHPREAWNAVLWSSSVEIYQNVILRD